MRSLRTRWIMTVVGVGLAGTMAVALVAVSVSMFSANMTVRGWLVGEAVNIRGAYDEMLIERFTNSAREAVIDLEQTPQATLEQELRVAISGVLMPRPADLLGVARPGRSLFSRGVTCVVPDEALSALGKPGAPPRVVRFSCGGIPALGVAVPSEKSGTVVIAGQLLNADYADALSRATQLEVSISGPTFETVSTFRDEAGQRLAAVFPSEEYGRHTAQVPHYRGYFGTPQWAGKGRDEVDFYYASVPLDDAAFPGATMSVCLPRSLVLQGTIFTVVMLLVTMGVMLLAMAAIARRLARHITGPLHSLVTMTKRISEGDLETELDPIGGALELEELGVSFNRMLHSLKDMRRRVFQTEKLAAVGQLSASVAHEINNPLAYIIGNLSYAIERTKEGEPFDDALTESLDGANRIAQIVRDLKTFSRAEEPEQATTRVDVETTLDSAVKMASNRIRHRARLMKNYSAAPEVIANPGRLAQVFLNLLVNAADAMEPGRADENQILIKLAQGAGEVVIEITDTGGGMPPEVRARLFEPFFTTKPIGVGTGLGLSICKNICEAAGGSIAIFPGPANRGTTVKVTLPIAPPEVEEPKTDPLIQVSALTLPDAPRVMVIDDDAAVLRSVRRMLEPSYRVLPVSSASEALEKLGGGERVDLVICDLMMPEVTGIELHEHLCRAAPGLSRRMLFITGGAFTPDAGAFLDQVRARVLEKPIGPQKLRDAVASAIAAADSPALSAGTAR